MSDRQQITYQHPPTVPTVHLRAAPLIVPIALHLYFVASSGDRPWDRWEVWQSKNAFHRTKTSRQKCYGHLHINLMHPLSGVGGGPSFLLQEWQGQAAEKIINALNNNAENYRFCDFYLAWPGPNSNTYVARILDAAEIDTFLPIQAFGKGWMPGIRNT